MLSAAEIRSLDDLRVRANTLRILLQSEGWKLLDEEMRKTAAFAYGAMIGTSVAHDAAKHMGAWHVAEALRQFPQREIDRTLMRIKIEEDKA